MTRRSTILEVLTDDPDWESIQSLLNDYLHASILWVSNSSGEIIRRYDENLSELCRLVRETKEGQRECDKSHFSRLQEVRRTGQPTVSACHCGLLAFAFPVFLHGQLQGVVGGTHERSELPMTMEKCAEISASCNVDLKDILERVRNIKYLTKADQRRFLTDLNIISGMIAISLKWFQSSMSLASAEKDFQAKLTLLNDICQLEPSKDNLMLVTSKIRESLGIDACSIYVFNEQENKLILTFTTGLPSRSIGRAITLGEGIVGYSAEMQMPISVEDVEKNERVVYPSRKNSSKKRRHLFRSVAAIPLLSNDKLLGVMDVRTIEPKVWHQKEIDFLLLLAEQIVRIIRGCL